MHYMKKLRKIKPNLPEDRELDKKFSMYFAVMIFAIIFLNQNALEFIAKVLGLIR